MIRLLSCRSLLAGLAVLSLHAAPRALVLHVATNGSDSWSGRSAGPNPSRTDGPFATVDRARDAIRELKAGHGGALQEPIEVYIHGGTYSLDHPLRFTAEDSGTAQCPITYAAAAGEQPIFSGGRSITGFTEATVDGKRLWKAEIPAVRDGQWYFHQLWMNGSRRTLARSPNTGFFRIAAVPDLDLKQQYFQGQTRFQYAPGDLARYRNPGDVDLVILSFWVSTRRGIADIDEASHTVTLDRRSSMRLTDGFGRTPQLARYYVENAFELLDAPGEWYLDRRAGILYYMPEPGEDIAKAAATAPVLDQLLSLESDPAADHNVEYLTFRGLTFSYSEWWLPAGTDANRYQTQGAALIPAAVRFYGASHCRLDQCTISHVSSYAIQFSRACHHDQLTRSRLSDLGAGGVKIGEPDRLGNVRPGVKSPFPDDARLEIHDIEVSDNSINSGDRIFHQGHGVWIGQSYNNLVSHNDIADLYQSGISVGWTWGYGKSLAHHNIIEYNHIHQIGQGWSSDLAGIYTLGTQPGTVLRDNLIHDVECADYVGRGIYLDEGTSDVVVENNIIYRTTTGGFGMNYGRRDVIRNNIFAFGDRSQIEPVGSMPKPDALAGSSYVLEHNIFYWSSGHDLLRGQLPRKQDELVFRNNFYWQAGAEAATVPNDEGAIVADPRFADPAHGDFRLERGSPAIGGFHAIDLSSVGPRR